ncbi:MAG TPA: protein kinase [Thermoanaerobaculia bacterium]|nr:protein kinase [Thermoanaerobaculia bacterium]
MNPGSPRTLGRYRLLSLLGEGGMGKVYRGFDSALRRSVAIKLLPPELGADPSRLARFVQEACAASALNHPNVVTVYDIGEERLDGDRERVRYIAMELVEGETLRDVVLRGPLELRDGLGIAVQIAEGLAAAHAAGIVHRDLKPENIMVNASGVVKLLDFGLASFPREEPPAPIRGQKTAMLKTAPGMLIGTAGYMAPEQILGHAVDARADVFSLGCVLHEIAAGQQAFEGDSPVDTLHKIIYGEPSPVREIRAGLPPELARIVRKSLEKSPEDRYQSANDVAADLRGLLHELNTNPSRVTAPVAVPRWTRKETWFALAAIVASILGILAVAVPLARRSHVQAPEPGAASLQLRRITATGQVTQAAISPDAKLTAYVVSDQDEQTLVVREMASGQTLTLVPPRRSSYWGLAFAPDSSSIHYGVKDAVDQAGAIYRISSLGGRPQKIVDAIDSRPAFSPDGKQMAFLRAGFPTRDESALLVANADGSGVRTLAKVHAPEFFVPIFFAGPSWSPDGKRIATAVVGRQMTRGTEYFTPEVARTSRIVGIDVATGSMETIADQNWAIVAQVAWMPDQKGLLAIAMGTSARNYQVWFVPYPSGEAWPVTHDLFDYRTVSVSADGKSLVTVASQINADVWVVRDGAKPQRITASKAEGIYGAVALPDGRLVTTSIETGKLDLFAMNQDGTGRVQITRDVYSNRSPAVTPDGKWIVYLSMTPQGPEICRIDADGSHRVVLAKTSVATAALDVSPDGKRVVYEDLRNGLAGVSGVSIDGGTAAHLGTEKLATPVFSPDGTKIAGLLGDVNGKAHLATMPASGGPATPVVPWAATAYSTARWTSGGTALIVNTVKGDHANLWRIPLDGAPPRKLTSFDEHVIFTFAPLPGEKGWVLSRGDLSRDAVLITGFRPPT